jgi:hypothetical protein
MSQFDWPITPKKNTSKAPQNEKIRFTLPPQKKKEKKKSGLGNSPS